MATDPKRTERALIGAFRPPVRCGSDSYTPNCCLNWRGIAPSPLMRVEQAGRLGRRPADEAPISTGIPVRVVALSFAKD